MRAQIYDDVSLSFSLSIWNQWAEYRTNKYTLHSLAMHRGRHTYMCGCVYAALYNWMVNVPLWAGWQHNRAKLTVAYAHERMSNTHDILSFVFTFRLMWPIHSFSLGTFHLSLFRFFLLLLLNVIELVWCICECVFVSYCLPCVFPKACGILYSCECVCVCHSPYRLFVVSFGCCTA